MQYVDCSRVKQERSQTCGGSLRSPDSSAKRILRGSEPDVNPSLHSNLHHDFAILSSDANKPKDAYFQYRPLTKVLFRV